MSLSFDERVTRANLLDTRAATTVRRSTVTDLHIRSLGNDGTLTFEGLASSTSVRSGDSLARDNGYDMGWYTERVMAGAFASTLSRSPDVSFFINHGGLALARTTNGTLDLRENPDRGLEFTARADTNDPDAANLARKIDTGLVDQCSFAFRITGRSWDEDRENLDITAVDLHRGDVSAVSYGANPATAVGVRSLVAMFADLTDEDVEDLRSDPQAQAAAARILRSEDTTDRQVERMSLDLARARAYALRKKPRR